MKTVNLQKGDWYILNGKYFLAIKPVNVSSNGTTFTGELLDYFVEREAVEFVKWLQSTEWFAAMGGKINQ